MIDTDKQRVRVLLCRLEQLEAKRLAPAEEPIRQVALQAIVDEISQLARQDGLAVYRNGNTLDAVILE